MALFGRDYDRNYGYRGGAGYNRGGYDRGIGGTARHAWNETKDETREGWNAIKRGGRNMTGGDYDRGYGRTGGTYGNSYAGGGYNRGGYDRGIGGTARYGWNETKDETREMFTGYDRGYGTADRGYGYGAGYDRNFHSRAETDYGDPFGDRTSQTPIRVMRGEFKGYDRGLNRNRNMGYDRNYSANPMGYDPGYSYNNRYDRNF